MTTYNRDDDSRQHIERDYQPESRLFGRQTVQGFLRNNLTFDHTYVHEHELLPDSPRHCCHLALGSGRGPMPI